MLGHQGGVDAEWADLRRAARGVQRLRTAGQRVGEESGVVGLVLGPLAGEVVFIEDRLNWADRLARTTVDALFWLDIQGALALIDAVHWALVHASAVYNIDTRLCDHIRHGPVSSIYYGIKKDTTPFYVIGGLMDFVAAVQVAVAFTWLGMVMGISFLEAPLKFRAPGMTVPLGVGIGRLVFRAMNIVEGVFGAVLLVTAALTVPQASKWSGGLIVAVVITLVVGARVLRPRMDARVRRGKTADGQPRHVLHIGYVVLECVKVVLLLAIGVAGLLG
jgi:hypothetical protein